LLLDLVYVQIVNPLFGYYGFSVVYGHHTLFSWLVLVSFSLFVSTFHESKEWFTSNVIILLFLIRFVPTTSIMGFIPMDNELLILECVYWVCLLLFARFLPLFQIRKTNMDPQTFLYLCFGLFSLGIIFISGYYTGFRLNFSFSNVYDLRKEARQFDMPSVLQYLWTASKNILPLLFVYFLDRRNKKMSIFTAVLILLNFSIN
jgi:hypothetical protein